MLSFDSRSRGEHLSAFYEVVSAKLRALLPEVSFEMRTADDEGEQYPHLVLGHPCGGSPIKISFDDDEYTVVWDASHTHEASPDAVVVLVRDIVEGRCGVYTAQSADGCWLGSHERDWCRSRADLRHSREQGPHEHESWPADAVRSKPKGRIYISSEQRLSSRRRSIRRGSLRHERRWAVNVSSTSSGTCGTCCGTSASRPSTPQRIHLTANCGAVGFWRTTLHALDCCRRARQLRSGSISARLF